MDCTVYADPAGKIDHSSDKPPTERYIDIMIEGATQHGVKPEYIEVLKNLEKQPRRNPEDFLKLDVPEGLPTWTMEDVAKGDHEDGRPMYTALNGKVIEYKFPDPLPAMYPIYKARAGKHMEVMMARNLYDPKYGTPTKIEDFTAEHRASIESMIAHMRT